MPTYKSRGERLLAGFLEENRIKFHYEYPLLVHDAGQLRIWYPDFWLPRLNIVIEYFGLYGNGDYDKGVLKKRRIYKDLEIDFIEVKKDTFRGNWQKYLVMAIMEILESKNSALNSLARLKEKYSH